MKGILLTLTVFATSLSITPSYATGTGNELLSECTSAIRYLDEGQGKDHFGIGHCLGLIQGIRDTLDLFSYAHPESGLKACIPTQVTTMQNIRVVVDYLQKNPDKLHQDTIVLTLIALREGFPCDK
ncbi:Rap1a/Tai family immunity protein [uncultured Methylophaga sp.]|uniref:Rap1a/Tai family immunity protein n=1 Tax=uncultured Methylophaga sp. TaxID=285271 RepID=UPI0030F76275